MVYSNFIVALFAFLTSDRLKLMIMGAKAIIITICFPKNSNQLWFYSWFEAWFDMSKKLGVKQINARSPFSKQTLNLHVKYLLGHEITKHT